jgi:hypothetical protein
MGAPVPDSIVKVFVVEVFWELNTSPMAMNAKSARAMDGSSRELRSR